jgi:hypothetical protein
LLLNKPRTASYNPSPPPQVDEMYREAPIKNQLFDYIEFTRILKHGAKENENEQ